MPNNDFPRFLKKLDALIETWTEYRHCRLGRVYLLYLIAMRAKYSTQRYLERPSKYRNHLTAIRDEDRLPKTDSKSRKMLRISLQELNILVNMFGQHEAFQPLRGRRPASPRVQLAVCLYRLATGNTEDTCERIFRLPRRFQSLVLQSSKKL